MPLNPPLRDWRGRLAWIVGGSAGIGRATAHELHQRGAIVVVSGRDAAALDAFTAEHPGSDALALDVTDVEQVRAAGQRLLQRHGRLDLVMFCAGHYRPMRATEYDLAQMLRHHEVNYVGALHVLEAALPPLLRARTGHISLVSSAAGYRGLPKALAYGPTKAALQHLAEVLYLDLHRRGIGVSVINPGFVATRLTAQNNFPMPALMTPEQAAREIVIGWERGRFEMHFPRRFTFWLKLLRLLPPRLYFAVVRLAV